MTLKLYNSLSKRIEEFKPVQENKVTMYNCGPTVYSFATIGNFRSFIVVDLLRRFLEYKGYEVQQVMNITDVGHLTDDADDGEDKLEKAAKKEKKHPLDIAKFYTEAFLKDWNILNMLEPTHRPKATETISEMISIIQELIKKGHAYESKGNVYFDITSFSDYGKLSGNYLENLTKNRVELDINKRNPQDFVLWFGNSKYKNHILKWDSPWGEGYPGWHIECTAMSAKFLTNAFTDGVFNAEQFETIDIHSGGEDNRFPHHECEIAQTEGVTNKTYVNYWIHIRHLMIEGEKMSKSKGNVYYVQGLIDDGFSPRAIRYLLLSTHYRLSMNFTKEGLQASMKSLERIDETLQKLNTIRTDISYNEPLGLLLSSMKLSIEKELNNDLNVSGAFGALFEAIKEINKAIQDETIGHHQAQEIIAEIIGLDSIFGIFPASILEEESLPSNIVDILEKRAQARNEKDWSTSDMLRNQLAQLGFEVKDTKDGQVCKKI